LFFITVDNRLRRFILGNLQLFGTSLLYLGFSLESSYFFRLFLFSRQSIDISVSLSLGGSQLSNFDNLWFWWNAVYFRSFLFFVVHFLQSFLYRLFFRLRNVWCQIIVRVALSNLLFIVVMLELFDMPILFLYVHFLYSCVMLLIVSVINMPTITYLAIPIVVL
jgi:hypothetical protein